MNWLSHFQFLRLLIVIGFVLACTNVSLNAQDPWEHFGEKHVGGEGPFGETSAEAQYRKQLSGAREDRVLKTGPLAVSKADRIAFASFLRAPDTGIVRLLPPAAVYRDYIRGRPITRHDQCLYSFANLTHSMVDGSDIRLNEDKLTAASPLGYGMMADIGDVPLEQIDLFDWRTNFLADYKRAATIMFARDESARFQNPVTVNGLRYQNSLPVEINSTYLLRAINYGRLLSIPIESGDEGRWRARRTDVLVAFRIVRKDNDGSVTIAWKLLKKYPTPNLDGKD